MAAPANIDINQKPLQVTSAAMSAFSQFFPPSPRFTEKNAPDQQGKVFLVTGASSGVGKELAKILFGLNGKVYVAGRSEANAQAAMSEIRAAAPSSKGELVFLPIDLQDLPSVKKAAATFLEQEKRLDVLWHNAGVMFPPAGSKTKQGYELQVGVHCVAAFLLTELLTPILIKTVKMSERGCVRVVWVSSSSAELMTSKKGCLDLQKWDRSYKLGPKDDQYGPSKAGMVLLSQEYAKYHKADGITSVAMNPGNLSSNLTRHTSWLFRHTTGILLYKPIFGAYTELFAGLSSEVGPSSSGGWVIPFGRVSSIRKDIRDAGKSESEGGSGLGQKLWTWCTEEVEEYTG